jgi:hypothetical protein
MTGSADPAPIEAALKARIGTIPRTPARAETRLLSARRHRAGMEESLPVKQGKLVLGFRAGLAHAEDDTPRSKVMAECVRGGTYSKLFVHVRERLSLCYYCSARLNTQKGLIFVQSGIEFDKDNPPPRRFCGNLSCSKPAISARGFSSVGTRAVLPSPRVSGFSGRTQRVVCRANPAEETENPR